MCRKRDILAPARHLVMMARTQVKTAQLNLDYTSTASETSRVCVNLGISEQRLLALQRGHHP